MTGAFDEAAHSVQSAWAAAFARSDWPALAALYAPEAQFWGSTATLYADRTGVLSYFEGLPAGFVAARYARPHILPLGPDVFAASGEVVFVRMVDGQEHELPFRMTQVLRQTPEGWRIAVHHASPRPA